MVNNNKNTEQGTHLSTAVFCTLQGFKPSMLQPNCLFDAGKVPVEKKTASSQK